MKKIFMLVLAMVLAGSATAATKSVAKPMPKMPDHGLVVPSDMHWGDAPAVFQPGAKMAVLQGNPGAAGPYTVRLKMPDGNRIMPHSHPTTQNVTVISGTFHLGMGAKFDDTAGAEMPAGSFGFLGPRMKHFAWTTGETEVQVHGMGPFKLVYVNPADNPSPSAAK